MNKNKDKIQNEKKKLTVIKICFSGGRVIEVQRIDDISKIQTFVDCMNYEFNYEIDKTF